MNNLHFSERGWKFEFSAKSGFYTNRIRYKQKLDLFNWQALKCRERGRRHGILLPILRNLRAKEFYDLPPDESYVSVFDVDLRQ